MTTPLSLRFTVSLLAGVAGFVAIALHLVAIGVPASPGASGAVMVVFIGTYVPSVIGVRRLIAPDVRSHDIEMSSRARSV
jgi:hypothetical protein